MCGIAGILDPGRGQGAIHEALGAMCAAMVHRGPNDEGIIAADAGGVGMRRLSIIDVAGGHQPFVSEDGSAALVFNGEIYNHHELRAELEALGRRFATKSDGEAILHGYLQWGAAVVERLDGMFAFAIHHPAERRVFLARDRFGKKPLYHAGLPGGGLAFASEIKALLALPEIARRPDHRALYHYLTLQYVPDPLTAFEGIRKFPAAHRADWRLGAPPPEPERYWRLAYDPKTPMSDGDAAALVREEVERAVRARLESEVPLGVFLSGGIDSTIVTAAMARHAATKVKTFSIGFDEDAFSELPHARLVAERFGTEHHEFVVRPDAAEALPRMVRAFDEPFADPSALATWRLSEQSRRHVTVALNGDGGDEIFAGYQRYRLDKFLRAYAAAPAALRRPIERALSGLAEPANVPIERNWRAGLKRLAQAAAADPGASIVAWGSYFSESMKREICSQEFLRAAGENEDSGRWIAERFASALASNHMERTLSADIETYLAGDLLVKADRMTMAHSLEGRSPFLDRRLAEKIARLPPRLKLRGGNHKFILKRAFAEEIPRGLIDRPKQGFGLPVGLWLREGPLAESLREKMESLAARGLFRREPLGRIMSEHKAGRADHGKRLWALLILEEWFQAYLGG